MHSRLGNPGLRQNFVQKTQWSCHDEIRSGQYLQAPFNWLRDGALGCFRLLQVAPAALSERRRRWSTNEVCCANVPSFQISNTTLPSSDRSDRFCTGAAKDYVGRSGSNDKRNLFGENNTFIQQLASVTYKRINYWRLVVLRQEYCRCVDGECRLGLSTSSIAFYKVGEQTRVPGSLPPELLPCAFIIGEVNTVEISMKGKVVFLLLCNETEKVW